MTGASWSDAVRGEGRFAPRDPEGRRSHETRNAGAANVPWAELARLVALGGCVFGAVMGSLSGAGLGTLHSALKVPSLLVLTTLVALPFFYVLNRVLGLAGDFAASVRGVLAAQATLAITLAALAPVVAFIYLTGIAYPTALLVCASCWSASALAAQINLARHYRPLVEREPRHRVALGLWAMLYAFVAIKLGWVLRPLIGDPALQRVFLRDGALDENPYVVLWWTVVGALHELALRLGLV